MRNKPLFQIIAYSGITLLVSSAVIAQLLYAGTWTLDATYTIPADGICAFSGNVDVDQDGSAVSGVASLELVEGGEGCPLSMTAGFSAVVGLMGVLENGVLFSEPLGSASFDGTLSPNPGGSGTTVVTQGPFLGATGTWSAQLSGVPLVAIPTLGSLGLASLAVLLVCSGVLLLRRTSSRGAAPGTAT